MAASPLTAYLAKGTLADHLDSDKVVQSESGTAQAQKGRLFAAQVLQLPILALLRATFTLQLFRHLLKTSQYPVDECA